MTTTPKLGLPEFEPAQALPETTANDVSRRVEQGASMFIVADKDATSPPGSPADGVAYIVAASATGAWSGKDGKIAYYQGTAWEFITPKDGFFAVVLDEGLLYHFVSSAWTAYTASGLLLAANNLSDIPDPAAARENLGVDHYRVGFFFTSAPQPSEVLMLHIATDPFTFPADFGTPDSLGAAGSNPASTFAIDVQRQVNGAGAFATIGTISISTGGAFTFTTASGTAKAIATNDVLKAVAPSSADASIANVAITLAGILD